MCSTCVFFFSSRRRHTRYWRDWSSDVCSSDLGHPLRDGYVDMAVLRNETFGCPDKRPYLQGFLYLPRTDSLQRFVERIQPVLLKDMLYFRSTKEAGIVGIRYVDVYLRTYTAALVGAIP